MRSAFHRILVASATFAASVASAQTQSCGAFASIASRNGASTGSPEPQERVRELVGDEGERLEAATRDDYAPFFAFARASGLRLRQCVTLQWSEVDWGARQIRKAGKGGQTRNRTDHPHDPRATLAAARASSGLRVHVPSGAHPRRPGEGRSIPPHLLRPQDRMATAAQAGWCQSASASMTSGMISERSSCARPATSRSCSGRSIIAISRPRRAMRTCSIRRSPTRWSECEVTEKSTDYPRKVS